MKDFKLGIWYKERYSNQTRMSVEVNMASTIFHGNETHTVLDRLGQDNPDLADVILDLGNRILNLPFVGLRDTNSTYDASFVIDPKPTIATFITPTYQGGFNSNLRNASHLTVQIHHLPCQQAHQIPHIKADPKSIAHEKEIHIIRISDAIRVGIAIQAIEEAHRIALIRASNFPHRS